MERDCFLYKLRRKFQVLASYIIPDEYLRKIYYWIILKRKLHLINPITFNEKIQWLTRNYLAMNDLVANCCDKFAVREYVKGKGLSDLLTTLYGSWDNANQIDWSTLPDKFVLKCSHGCAYNILWSDKNKLDKEKTVKQLNEWLKEDFGRFNLELHYSRIKEHKIICEEYLGDCITDYKFFCFNGKPKFVYVSNDLIHDRQAKISYFNIDGSQIPIIRDDYAPMENVVFPPFFKDMVKDAENLSKDFPFVRVDFFIANNRYYFAELTFNPAGGFNCVSVKYDRLWGSYIDLSKCSLQKQNHDVAFKSK